MTESDGQARERVCSTGVLRGRGQEAICTVFATKVTLLDTKKSTHTEYSIENVSKALPDGGYELTVYGEILRVRYKRGYWLGAP